MPSCCGKVYSTSIWHPNWVNLPKTFVDDQLWFGLSFLWCLNFSLNHLSQQNHLTQADLTRFLWVSLINFKDFKLKNLLENALPSYYWHHEISRRDEKEAMIFDGEDCHQLSSFFLVNLLRDILCKVYQWAVSWEDGLRPHPRVSPLIYLFQILVLNDRPKCLKKRCKDLSSRYLQ